MAPPAARAIMKYARQRSLDPLLIVGIIGVENATLVSRARSRVGAQGVMQVMPSWKRDIKECGGDLRDVFVNVVGGVRISETAADLPAVLATVSSSRDEPLAGRLVCFGELGLAGEIRPVPYGEERLREAAKHGFERAIVPEANKPRRAIEGLRVIGVERLADALRNAF